MEMLSYNSLPVEIRDRILCYRLHPALLLYYGRWRSLLYHETHRSSIRRVFRSNATLFHIDAHFQYIKKMQRARADFDDAVDGDRQWDTFLRTGDDRHYAWEDTDIYPSWSVPLPQHAATARCRRACDFERQYECLLQDAEAREEWVSQWWSPLYNHPRMIADPVSYTHLTLPTIYSV